MRDAGVLGAATNSTSGSVRSAAAAFPGPPNSFFSRNRKNKYVSIFSTVSRDSTRDSLRCARHGDPPSEGGSAALGFGESTSGAGARHRRRDSGAGAGVFGAAAAAYAASAGMQQSDADKALAIELRKGLTHTSSAVNSPPNSPVELMMTVPGRHYFTTQGFEARETGVGASSSRSAYTESPGMVAAAPPLSQSTTLQMAHSPLAYATRTLLLLTRAACSCR